MATKTLNFYTYGLQKDTTVMLMFQPPSNVKLYRDQFPVVWKVITFRAGGHAKASVKYVARLAFGYAQTSGDMSSITGSAGDKRFGPTTKREGTKLLVCKNNTDQRANLSIGFVKGDGIDQRFEPTLVWMGVGSKSNITAQFTPILTAYVTRDYQESQLLRGEVETDAIWTQNINEIDDVTGWNFTEDDSSGSFVIEPANGP
ncbi:hypothetical protein FRC10_008981 [Ceratobasidium sp. 414]|nr:hypothetical protein FRC10_008981 [Ceratobasidium sp. 414]